MNELMLEARDLRSKPNAIRNNQFVPGVIYGQGVKESIPVKMTRKNLKRQLCQDGEIYHAIIGSKKYTAKIASLQRDPVSRKIIHFSLHQLSTKENVEVEIPIDFIGKAKGENSNGVVLKQLEKLNVVGKISNIPDSIELNIEALDIGESITVSDIKDFKKIDINHDPNDVIVVCTPPTVLTEKSDDEVNSETNKEELSTVDTTSD